MAEAKGILRHAVADAVDQSSTLTPGLMDPLWSHLLSEGIAVLNTATYFVGFPIEERSVSHPSNFDALPGDGLIQRLEPHADPCHADQALPMKTLNFGSPVTITAGSRRAVAIVNAST